MDDSNCPILEFERVVLDSGQESESSLCDVRFTLRPGELLLVLLDREHIHLPLADASSGLIAPVQGCVRYCGRDWRELGTADAAAQRGRIGRLFDEECWIANLDLDENLTLAQRHHTRRDLTALRNEASELAQHFFLPGLPLGQPGGYWPQDLQKAACVRAFIREPVLILLERPTHSVYADIMSPLANAVYAARRRGTAVLWTTDNRRVWNDAGLKPTQRALICGARWHLEDSDGEAIPIPTCQ